MMMVDPPSYGEDRVRYPDVSTTVAVRTHDGARARGQCTRHVKTTVALCYSSDDLMIAMMMTKGIDEHKRINFDNKHDVDCAVKVVADVVGTP